MGKVGKLEGSCVGNAGKFVGSWVVLVVVRRCRSMLAAGAAKGFWRSIRAASKEKPENGGGVGEELRLKGVLS